MRRFGWSLVAVALFCAFVARAQILSPILNDTNHAGGGGNPFALVAHTGCAALSSCTSGTVDTTGTKLIVINEFKFTSATGATPTDNKSNTYTQLTPCAPAGATFYSCLYYAISPTVGSGHTFSWSASGAAGGIVVEAFSDSAGTPTLDQNNAGNTGTSCTTIQPGSVTPSANNEVLISGVAFQDGASGTDNYTINSAFTRTDQFPFTSGSNEGGAIAYLLQTTAAAVNPTWTNTSSANTCGAVVATFK